VDVLVQGHQFQVQVHQDFLLSLDLVDLGLDFVQLLLLLSLVHVELSQNLLLLDDVVLVLLRVLVGCHRAVLGRVESLQVGRSAASLRRLH
jgi:hypothetical protein